MKLPVLITFLYLAAASAPTSASGQATQDVITIAALAKAPIAEHPELLSDDALRPLYAYHVERRTAEIRRIRELASTLGFDDAEIVSLVKGENPSSDGETSYNAFKDEVIEKVRRGGYERLDQMVDMSRGRISLDTFDQVLEFVLETTRTRKISGITYPSAAPAEFVAELKRTLKDSVLEERKGDYARVHVGLLDPGTGFVYELQVGTKRFDSLLQDKIVRVPEPLIPVFTKIGPYDISGGKADLHLVYYKGFMKLAAADPKLAALPEMAGFFRDMNLACSAAGFGAKPADTPLLAREAEGLLRTLDQRDPNIFSRLLAGEQPE